METMERDPKYIAKTVKLWRKMFGLTQENLADAANLTSRTIEQVESGRHRPNEQTLRSIARALNMEFQVFDKPTPEKERRQRMEIERAICKTVFVPTASIRDARDFLSCFGQRHAFRFDTSAVEDDNAMEVAAAMVDWIKDLNDIWEEVYQSERLSYARSFAELCQDIEGQGYVCHIGSHRQRLREKGKPDIIFDVGLMVLLPKDQADGERVVMVQLDGAWETLEQDRFQVPEDGWNPFQ